MDALQKLTKSDKPLTVEEKCDVLLMVLTLVTSELNRLEDRIVKLEKESISNIDFGKAVAC